MLGQVSKHRQVCGSHWGVGRADALVQSLSLALQQNHSQQLDWVNSDRLQAPVSTPLIGLILTGCKYRYPHP